MFEVIYDRIKHGTISVFPMIRGEISESVYIDKLQETFPSLSDSDCSEILQQHACKIEEIIFVYWDVYGKPDAKSGMLILKAAPLPEDILTLGIDGVNQIWRDAKLRAVGKARAKILIENSIGNRNMNDLEQGKYDGYRDIFDLLDEVKQMKFKKGDKVFHKNLKLFGIFVDYAWENPNEEADVDFEMEDGYIEQRHVSINQLQKYPSNEEIGKRLEGITVDELRIKIEQLIEDLENETVNRNMNDMEEGRYKTLCEGLDLIDEQKK